MTPSPGTWRRVALGMFAVGWGANQFSSMLVVYRDELGLSSGTLAALFGVYALGLVPGLLIGGPASDRYGRRTLVVAFVALSPLASLLLIVGRDGAEGLAAARLLAGVCSGVVFAAGSAWVQELSAGAPSGAGARRAAVALTAGFGSGPVVAALVAQVAAAPRVLAFVPHVVLGVVALAVLVRAGGVPETAPSAGGRIRVGLPRAVRGGAFVRVVVPTAPWVFAAAAISFAVLPERVGDDVPVAFAGLVTGVTLGCGVLVQPLARRVEDRRPLRAGTLGLVAAAAGAALGAGVLALGAPVLLLVCAPVLGAAYGLCLVSGLRLSERLAAPQERGATLAVFYALTYMGFGAPYALTAVAGLTGDVGALLAAAALAAATAGWVSRARTDRAPT
ncbi:MFS transporter [Conexibacter sp. W3-3-2]|uniref:MFS transporter n=1 Tax=Conexibacter sp. W3-3-2 TaxID=2675227 RepID=UPI0012B8F107|nr:MFS transporter [Conexibacter sp. W3-3-2]MTD44608.1 MFS transporter [Conexibacter sp. W3-3-2]